MDSSRLITVAIQAALSAGDLLRKGCGSTYQVFAKPGLHNIATEFDHAAEKIIITQIRETFPDHAILAEESGASEIKDAPVLWIIDPLDGTTNFSRNIPLFAVNIAAVIHNQVVAAVTYLPMLHELFIAEKGRGAYLNGVKLQVSGVNHFEKAVVAMGFPYNEGREALFSIELFSTIATKGNPIRDFGSAAINLAYVAAGRFDAFWIPCLHPWDMAPGKLLVEEAGGKLSQYDQKPLEITQSSSLIATNGRLHKELGAYFKRMA